MDLYIHAPLHPCQYCMLFQGIKQTNVLKNMKEQLINSHSIDELTDERGTQGNTGQLRKVNSCCYIKLRFAETFKIPD